MRNNKSKSCYKSFNNGKTKLYFNETNHLNRSRNELPFEQFNFEKLLQQLVQGIMKLFVVLKYIIFTYVLKPAQKNHVPWFKMSFLSLLTFILLKNDMKFTVNMPSAKATLAKYETEPPVSRNETWLGASFIPESRPSNSETKKSTKKAPVKKKVVNPFAPLSTDNLNEIETKAYIRRFEKVAVTEMQKFGIPASIKMAQGIIESHNGKSRLARENNNHFGVKCFSKKCKKGHCGNFNDDHHKDFFRKYKTPWTSWRSHSQLLSSGRYQKLKSYGTDYKKWAKGLKELGYATDKNYERKLIYTIEKFQLYLLDRA